MSNPKTPIRTVRCAIYTRKSTEEGLDQDFNSLDAQREAGEAFIKSQAHEGWQCLPDRFDDGGFTGANLERPAVQSLLAQIQLGAIDCVVVYKVDRLSRSLMDFARMIEVFEKHQVAFVSVTQQFNTANSMGRLVLNVLLSFAQFEREMISERTRDKIAATRRKGRWCGGLPVLGYDVVDRKLVVNPIEAERVRGIFAAYLTQRSLLAVVRQLEQAGSVGKVWTTQKGTTRGGCRFTKPSLYQLLTNVTYIGKIRHKQEVFAGEHAAIVDGEQFEAVQTALRSAGNSSGVRYSKRSALLKGLLTCAACDRAMISTYSSRGPYYHCYYVCTAAQRHGWDSCPSPSIPAVEIERFVVNELWAIGRDPQLITASLAAGPQRSNGAKSPSAAQMLAVLQEMERGWQTLNPVAQNSLLHRALEGIAYDARQSQIRLRFRPQGILELATEPTFIEEAK